MSTQIADLRVLLSTDQSKLNSEVRAAMNVLKSYAADAKQAEDATFGFGRSFNDTADLLSEKSVAIVQGFNVVQGAVLGLTGTAVGLAASVSALAQQGRELEQMALKAGVSVERMQELAYATEQYNVTGDQLSDMLKDVQDKLGDFSATGGGEFKDWMDNIAPKVGLTVSKLQQMAGPEALIAVQNAMDATNVSASEQVFYLEAIANDVSVLQPLLRNNGAELQRLTTHYRNLNVALSETDISQLKELDQKLKDIGLRLQSAFAQGVLGASEQIDWLTEKLGYAVSYWGTLLDSWADNPRTIDGMSRRLGNLREELGDLDEQIIEVSSTQKQFGGVSVWDALLGDTAGKSALPELQQRRAEIEAEIQRIQDAYGRKRFGIGEQPEYLPPEPPSSRDTSADTQKLLDQGERRLATLDMQYADELEKMRLAHQDRLDEIDGMQISEAELRRRGYDSLEELRDEYRQREADYFTQEQADYMAKREEAMAKELEADQRKQDALAEQERQRIEKQKAFQQQAARDVINFTTQTISLTTDMLQQSGKDQTFVMKALLAAQKLLAIPSIIVAGQLAEANAAAFASMTGGMMSAEAARQMMRIQTMVSVGLVAGTAIAGMAHSGIEEVPREGTWLLDRGERVYTNRSAERIDQMYDQVMAGGSAMGAGAVFEQHLHFTADMQESERAQLITQAAKQGYQLFIDDVSNRGQGRRILGI
ncbi:hypothetical protein NUK47_11505 [Aeromonas hydrophila]|uniref:hypothetical protein n=1 Tax=Aeromonas hydrophila TaxID=644 RepID=UPI00214D4E4F|nr:hypothetical protein [Aeromonas hydrophila]MCR3909402.1 hypothetical protein [Aeromonas hydrophila]